MLNIKELTVKETARISLFAALIGVGAFVSIPLGPVPITFQSLFVILSAMVLGRKSIYSVGIYIVLGIMGIPIFAGFSGGIEKIFSPSFGFLLAMLPASYIMGYFFEKQNTYNFTNLFIISIIGTFILYLIGVPYMTYILNVYMGKGLGMNYILTNGMFLFLPGDILKCVIAVLSAKQLMKL